MRRLASLSCLDRVNSDDGVWVVLFHGWGADANDLYPLADVFSCPPTTNWLFPNGPLEVPIGFAMMGRGWWQIDLEEIQAAQSKGIERNLSLQMPAGVPAVRKKVLEGLAQLKVPWNKIILGGFSQGGMLATDIYLNAPETPRGLLVLSGALMGAKDWEGVASKRAGEEFYISHGKQDSVLSFTNGQRLETFLRQHGMTGTFQIFNGGHEIPANVLTGASQYLQKKILK